MGVRVVHGAGLGATFSTSCSSAIRVASVGTNHQRIQELGYGCVSARIEGADPMAALVELALVSHPRIHDAMPESWSPSSLSDLKNRSENLTG